MAQGIVPAHERVPPIHRDHHRMNRPRRFRHRHTVQKRKCQVKGALSGIALSSVYLCRVHYITFGFLRHATHPRSSVGREVWSFLGLYRPPIESVCESLAAPGVECCLSQPCFHCAQYWQSHWLFPLPPPHQPRLPLPAKHRHPTKIMTSAFKPLKK